MFSYSGFKVSELMLKSDSYWADFWIQWQIGIYFQSSGYLVFPAPLVKKKAVFFPMYVFVTFVKNQMAIGQGCSLSGQVPAWQTQGSDFKPQHQVGIAAWAYFWTFYPILFYCFICLFCTSTMLFCYCYSIV
jgi:hypothetical protein